MAGRPHKFTEQTITRLEQALKLGSTLEMAARYAGITHETLNEWRNGRTPRGITKAQHAEFLDRLEAASAEAGVQWLAKIEAAANSGSWRAAAWKLERRYPNEWGRRVVRVEHAGTEDSPPIKTEASGQVDVQHLVAFDLLPHLEAEDFDLLDDVMERASARKAALEEAGDDPGAD